MEAQKNQIIDRMVYVAELMFELSKEPDTEENQIWFSELDEEYRGLDRDLSFLDLGMEIPSEREYVKPARSKYTAKKRYEKFSEAHLFKLADKILETESKVEAVKEGRKAVAKIKKLKKEGNPVKEPEKVRKVKKFLLDRAGKIIGFKKRGRMPKTVLVKKGRSLVEVKVWKAVEL